MDDDQFEIRIQRQPPASRGKRSRKRSLLGLALTAVLMIALVVVGLLLLPAEDREPAQDLSSQVTENAAENSQQLATTPVDKADNAQPAAPPDDGESLWISPTTGAPIDCRYLLPGSQLIMHVRVAALRSHPEGEKLLAALGPWGTTIEQRVIALTDVAMNAIDTLTLGIRQTRSGTLEYSLKLHLLQPITAAQPPAGCYLPDDNDGKLLVYCDPSALAGLKGQGSEPPLFSRELKRVLDATDDQRIATVAFAGKFLQISGEKFLSGAGEQLQTATVDFLGDEATASSISAHWDDNFFLELQSTVALNERPHRFAAVLSKRVAEFSDQAENAIFDQPLHPYGRKVLARFPAMLRKLSNYTRAGESEKLSLLRCYLPVTAGHNLLLASELLLHTDRFSVASQDDRQAANSSAPQSIADRLAGSTSLVFPKETLERALEMLSEDIGIAIQIAGRDLQLEGITKNQSFAIELREEPAAEILLAILLRANPDRTAAGPTDEKQKLVYVVREPAAGGPSVIVVTTRAAAGRRGEKLPAVFRSSPR